METIYYQPHVRVAKFYTAPNGTLPECACCGSGIRKVVKLTNGMLLGRACAKRLFTGASGSQTYYLPLESARKLGL